MHLCKNASRLFFASLTSVGLLCAASAQAGGFERVEKQAQVTEAGAMQLVPETEGANLDMNHKGGWHSFIGAERAKSPVPIRLEENDTAYQLSAGTAIMLHQDRKSRRSASFVLGYSVSDSLQDSQASGLGTFGAIPGETDHQVHASFKLNF